MMFAQYGQPVVRPPHTPEVVQEHGEEVSAVAQDLGESAAVVVPGPGVVPDDTGEEDDSPELNPNNTFNPPTDKDEENNDSPELNPQNSWNPVENDKVEAVNDRSGKPMPTEVPQNAVDNSPALSPAPAPQPAPVEQPVLPIPVPPPVKDWPHEEVLDHHLAP